MSYLNNKYINKVEPHKLISEEGDDFVIDFIYSIIILA